MGDDRSASRAAVVLLVVTCVWGSTFAIAKDLLRDAPPFLYLAIRFGIASLSLSGMAFPRGSSMGIAYDED